MSPARSLPDAWPCKTPEGHVAAHQQVPLGTAQHRWKSADCRRAAAGQPIQHSVSMQHSCRHDAGTMQAPCVPMQISCRHHLAHRRAHRRGRATPLEHRPVHLKSQHTATEQLQANLRLLPDWAALRPAERLRRSCSAQEAGICAPSTRPGSLCQQIAIEQLWVHCRLPSRTALSPAKQP